MPSAVDISNIALAHIGAESLVTSISPPDGSAEAGYCATFYPIARRAALEYWNWSFARTRVQLSEVTNQSTIWRYAYALPSSCLTARRVLPLSVIQAASMLIWPQGLSWPYSDYVWMDDLFSERGSSDFELEGTTLYTNEPDAWLLYTTDVTDTSKFSPMFVAGVGELLASYLSGPIIKGREGATVGAQWRQQAWSTLDKACETDANASSERTDFVPQSIQVRG